MCCLPALFALLDPRVQEALRPLADPPPVVRARHETARFPDDGLHRLVIDPRGGDQIAGAGTSGGDVPEMRFGHPAVDALAALPGVRSVTPIGDGSFGVVVDDPGLLDTTVFEVSDDVPMGFTADPYEPYQWALDNQGDALDRLPDAPAHVDGADIGWRGALEAATGRGVTVAVVDSGVDFSHPDLRGTSWVNTEERCGNRLDDDANGFVDDCRGWDFAADDRTPFDEHSDPHGTHVAGIIAAGRNGQGMVGVAPRAQLMDLNVATRTGGHTSVTLSSVAGAIRYAADNGADIINLSLGTPPGTSRAAVQPLVDALIHAADLGVVVVVAAGNNAVDLDRTAVYPASLDLPNMVVVGASTPADDVADFSNYGPDTVDLFAPGATVLSAVPGNGYRFMSGTSQSAPLVAGALALAAEYHGDLPMPEVVATLLDGAEVVPALDGASRYGSRLDLVAVLDLDDDGTTTAAEVGELEVTVGGFGTVRSLSGGSFSLDLGVDFRVPNDWFAEPYQWEAMVVTATDDGPMVLLDHPVVVDGHSRSTGPTGGVRLGPGGISTAGLELALQAGDYALVLDAVPLDDPAARLGPSHVVPFVVGDEVAAMSEVDADAVSEARTEVADDPAIDDPDDGAIGDEAAPNGTPADRSSDRSNESADRGATWGSGRGSGWGTSGWGGDGWHSGGGSSYGTAGWGTGGWSSGSGDAWGTTDWLESGWTSGSGDGVGTEGWDTSISSSGAGDGVGTSEWGGTGWTGVDQGADADPAGAVADPGAGGSTDAAANGSLVPDSSSGPDLSDPAALAEIAERLRPEPTEQPVGESGEWAITDVSPTTGRVEALDRVTLNGVFPDDVYVWFGDEPGTVIHQNRRSITVQTPVVDEPGVVAISLRRSGAGTVLQLPDAFAFQVVDLASWVSEHGLDGDGVPGASGPTTATDGSSDPTAPPDGSPPSRPSTVEPTDTAGGGPQAGSGHAGPGGDAGPGAGGGTEGDGSNGSSSTDGDASAPASEVEITSDEGDLAAATRAPRTGRVAFGSPVALGDGRTGARLEGLNPFSGTSPCLGSCRPLRW